MVILMMMNQKIISPPKPPPISNTDSGLTHALTMSGEAMHQRPPRMMRAA